MVFPRSILFSLPILFLYLSAAYALPTKLNLEITAERFEILSQGEKILAEGNVFVQTQNLLILADRLTYQPATELLTLEDFHLQELTENLVIRGNLATFDLRMDEFYSEQLFLYSKKQGIRIRAFEFSKNPLNEYYAKRAIVTTCEMDCEKEEFPPWSVEVKNFVFGPDELSKADSTKFRVKSLSLIHLPKVLFLPRGSLPIFQERKRGFLFPNLTVGSRLGFGMQIPYYLPVTDQIDFTLSPLYLTKRGLLFDLENRVTFTKNVRSILHYRFLNDSKRAHYEPEAPKAPDKRWWITTKIDVGIKENVDAHLDLDFVSDKGFLEEFNVGEGGFDRTKARFLETLHRDLEDKAQDYRTSSFWIQGFKDSLYGRLVSSFFDYHGAQDKDSILQPLANLHLTFLPFSWRTIFPTLQLDYQYFYRQKEYYGHRVSSSLELNLPLQFHALRNLFSLALNENFYTLNQKGNLTAHSYLKSYLTATFSSYSILRKDYELNLSETTKVQFEHVLKPYGLLRWQSKPTEEEGPILVEEDLLTQKTLALEYGLWQFINLRKKKNFFVLKAYQIYDLEKAKKSATNLPPEERALSDLNLQALLQGDKISARYDTSYNFYGYGFKRQDVTLSLHKVFLDRLSLKYQEDKAWQTKQAIIELYHTLWKKLGLNFYLSKNLRLEETSELKINLTYLHDCYLIGLGLTSTPKDTKYHFMINLVGFLGLDPVHQVN